MPDLNPNNEPPIDPLADTNPSLTMRPVEVDNRPTDQWQRRAGFLSLLIAAGLTAATTLLLISPSDTSPMPNIPPESFETTVTPFPTNEPQPTNIVQQVDPNLIPTLPPDVLASLLSMPVVAASNNGISVVRDIYNPFTIIPDRPRSEVIQYTAVQGDTIYSIAERFGLQPVSIGWSNPRRYIQVLRPGDVLNIPPVEGIYHQVVGSRTIAEIASDYRGSDPYVIIDSEYNDLFGTPPDTILPSGTWIFVPGGRAEDITWNPGVQVEQEGPRRGYVSVFAPGDPGSCGNVNNPGGGAGWSNPLPSGTWMRGFDGIHTGVDLAAPIGTPIQAANSGAVIFAGWNSWGYGNTVVLAHGPFLTLYGHMNSISVGCGQLVSVGQSVGTVGSTGNSSGPHLHFEIRNGDTPSDPSATIGF